MGAHSYGQTRLLLYMCYLSTHLISLLESVRYKDWDKNSAIFIRKKIFQPSFEHGSFEIDLLNYHTFRCEKVIVFQFPEEIYLVYISFV